MYRLKAKFSPIVVAAVVIFGAAIVIFPQQSTFSGGYHFHYAVLVLIELGISLVAAFILFDRGNFVHKYKISLSVLALSCFYGLLGNLFYNFWKVNPGMDLEFSTAQLVIMNLGGVLTALALYKLEPIDAFSDGGLDRLQKGKSPQAEGVALEGAGPNNSAQSLSTPGVNSEASAVSSPGMDVPSPKTSVNKLRGITGSKTDIPAQEPEQEQIQASTQTEEKKYSSPPQVEIDLEASDEMLSGPLNPNPQASSSSSTASQDSKASATANRMQAAKRRNTSTFTKLQALSASGTGSLTDPDHKVTESSGDLRSLLDRLDTEDEAANADQTPVQEQAPASQPRMETKPKPEVEYKPKPEPAPRVKEKFQTPKAISADYLFDDLESKVAPEPAPVPEAVHIPEPEPTPAPEPEPVVKSDLESLLDRAEESLPQEEISPDKSGEVDQIKEDEGSALDDSVSGLLSKRFMELSDDEEEPVKAEVAKEEPITPPEEAAKDIAAAVESEIAEAQNKVFGTGVDSEIDDIFSNLAPEEAQKEVGETPAAKTDTPEEKEEEEKLFDQDVGSEIDDIFSGLAPEEAQKEVGDVLTAKKVEPAEEKPEEKEEDGDGIFKLKDDDVDDIFAGLTTEDQKDVDAASLAKVKERTAQEAEPQAEEKPSTAPKTGKQTGDMPALNKEQAEKIREQASKPGRFSDTLSKIPSLKNTVEGLLHSLEEEQGAQDLDDDTDLDMEPEEEIVPEENLSPEQKAAQDAAKKLKDFGRLSSKAVAKPATESESQGTMKTIGKLLIDKQAVEKIIKSGESKELGKGLSNARIISAARGKGISDLLTKIDLYDGVVGSIVVGHDGLVMASTLREGWDKDMMGALSTALLSTSNLTTKKLEIGKLRQMVMLTQDNGQAKTTVLTDVDVGILAVFVEETDVAKIDGLLTTIQETIHG